MESSSANKEQRPPQIVREKIDAYLRSPEGKERLGATAENYVELYNAMEREWLELRKNAGITDSDASIAATGESLRKLREMLPNAPQKDWNYQ